jgi:hypothetical protein
MMSDDPYIVVQVGNPPHPLALSKEEYDALYEGCDPQAMEWARGDMNTWLAMEKIINPEGLDDAELIERGEFDFRALYGTS